MRLIHKAAFFVQPPFDQSAANGGKGAQCAGCCILDEWQLSYYFWRHQRLPLRSFKMKADMSIEIQSVSIDGHLTEEKLGNALRSIVPSHNWLGCQVGIDEDGLRRLKWDVGYVQNGQKVYVEFDGHLHYQNPAQISRDKRKDLLATERGIRTIRIPYFVQLTSTTLLHYFGMDANIIQDFKHGFITSKEYPSSYCELGQARFLSDLKVSPTAVRRDILASLEERALDTKIAQENGREFVIPAWLDKSQ